MDVAVRLSNFVKNGGSCNVKTIGRTLLKLGILVKIK